MSGISSGVGLISGIDSGALIDQLIALESRPLNALRTRAQALDTKRTAYAELSAQILAIRNTVANFNKTSFFRRFTAAPSKDGIVRATTRETATAGTTTLRVHSLVSNSAYISRGFASRDATTIGAGTISLELGQGRVNPATDLNVLNGGSGVRRGIITITDRSGASADIDLRAAVTVDDVLEAINSDARIRVNARATGLPSTSTDGTEHTGERIVLEDISDGTGSLRVADKNGGSAAADLGIAGEAPGARLDGSDLLRLTLDTPLSQLNDGNGVDRLGLSGNDLTFQTGSGEFQVALTDNLDGSTDLRALNNGRGVRLGVIRITDRLGKSVDVDLRELATSPRITTLDVRRKIAAALDAAGVEASITTVNSSFLISDSVERRENPKALTVEDVSGFSAEDLGIAGSNTNGTILGRAVYRVATIGDVIRAINYAPANDGLVRASLSGDGNGITLEALGFDNSVTVAAGVNDDGRASTAARDLGILGATFSSNESVQSRALLGGLNTVLLSTLKGGAGLNGGRVSLTDASGRTREVDFSSARTLQDVIDLINVSEDSSIRASLNAVGNGIALRDSSSAAGEIVVTDVAGTLAADLGIAGRFDAQAERGVQGGNLQHQYVARTTKLADLNGGRGINLGDFRITDSTGLIYSVSLAKNLTTVGQVIDAINAATPDTLQAEINATGDGIVITDRSAGSGQLTVEDVVGRTAKDFRLAGKAQVGSNRIDGSFEIRVDVSGGDSLDAIVKNLNFASDLVSAGVLQDGGRTNPFSLTISSNVSGRRGELLIDTGDLDLGLSVLSRARDAVVTLGGSSAVNPIVLTSSTNRIDGAVQGVSFDLLSTSNDDVTVTVSEDRSGIADAIKTFVEKYNDTIAKLREKTSFNNETLERGTLFGDSTAELVQSRLYRDVLRSYTTADASITHLSSIGIRLGTGNRLEFDQARFDAAYERAPQAVEELFTKSQTGFGATVQRTLDDLTQSATGAIARRDAALDDQKQLLNDRAAALEVLIQAKRTRLEAQFAALETALANLQKQQTALNGLAQLTGTSA